LCNGGLDDTWRVFGRAELAKARREHNGGEQGRLLAGTVCLVLSDVHGVLTRGMYYLAK
jgi:hypothetical protein